MSRLIILLSCTVLLLIPELGHAGVKNDYEQAKKFYVAAGACMAAYSDRYGQLANKYLERDGWRIEGFRRIGDAIDSRFLLVTKQRNQGHHMYILAFAGTENERDMKANLMVDKVYFAGSRLEEFAINAAQQGVPPSEPKVHRGFHEFVQIGLATKVQDVNDESKYISEMLLADKERKLLLVGHSRGGAAATLAGARLISMGVRPEQIEIITFGAPAVGNAVFANHFEPVLNLKRVVISGDPVTGVLQTLVGGYKQFGREVLWEAPATVDEPHRMTEYADIAIKQYYDKREQALRAGLVQLPSFAADVGAGRGKVYVVQLKNSLPDYMAKEFWYIKQALYDEYRQILPAYVFADDSATDHLLDRAADAGCKWLLVPEVSGHRLKGERNVYSIALLQVVVDVTDGKVVKAAGFSSGTYNLTPLEAFIHVCKGMTYDWLIKKTPSIQ